MDPELSTIKRCIAIILKQFDYKKRELCSKPLKELVTIIRKVEGIVPAFIDVLFEHLRREDSDLRLAILLIANHFFQRSHNFRLELINSIQDFLVYVLETDPLHYPLPKPAEAANILKKEAMVTLRYWIEKFGAGYAKLQKLENFLKNSKSLDWENSAAELQIDRERAAQEDFHKAVKARKIVEQVSKLYGEFRPEIERLQLEADTVVELLFPHFCPIGTHLNGKELAQAQGSSIHDQLHAFGTSNSGGITICLNAKEVVIENTPDNADLINQVKDTTKQLDKWQSKLGKWIAKLTEAGDSSSLMRQLIDAKRNMCERLQKCKEFVFPMPRNGNVEEESDSADDSDFVDVEEKEGYEPEFVEEDEQCKPSTSQCHHFGPRPSIPIPNKSRGKSVEAVQAEKKPVEEEGPPRLTMGLDLKYWGQSEVKPAQRTRNQVGDDSFWMPANSDDGNAPTEDMESYTSRQITFIGKMPAIEKMCRAPLPSGRLCPRMERHRCALHGLIVDRDEQGFPMEEQSCAESKKISDREKQRKELEEKEYLQDLEEATGAKLRLPEKKTTGGRTARPREKSENVKSRERLKSKLFDKRALKRVSATLEQIQKARAERNFAHQFNYAVTRR